MLGIEHSIMQGVAPEKGVDNLDDWSNTVGSNLGRIKMVFYPRKRE